MANQITIDLDTFLDLAHRCKEAEIHEEKLVAEVSHARQMATELCMDNENLHSRNEELSDLENLRRKLMVEKHTPAVLLDLRSVLQESITEGEIKNCDEIQNFFEWLDAAPQGKFEE